MHVTWTMIFTVCIFIFIAGLIDSIAGGGGMISLPAYFFVGLPPHIAYGTNKFTSSFGTLISAWNYYKQGKIHKKVAFTAIIGSILGSVAGSNLNLYLDERILKICFLILLPLAAIVVLSKNILKEKEQQAELSHRKTAFLSFLIGLVIGGYDGFFGPGTGAFLIIAFTGILNLDYVTASGSAKAINFASNLGSLTVFLLHGKVLFAIALPAVLFSILGNFLGSRLAIKKGEQVIKPVLVLVMILLVAKIISDYIS